VLPLIKSVAVQEGKRQTVLEITSYSPFPRLYQLMVGGVPLREASMTRIFAVNSGVATVITYSVGLVLSIDATSMMVIFRLLRFY
jgi:hypothetical protein